MKSRNLHLLNLSILIVVSILLWLDQRNQRVASEITGQAAQQQIDDLTAKRRTTTERIGLIQTQIEARSQAITDQLNEMARLQAERDERRQEQLAIPDAELPYQWNDDSPTARLGKRFLASLNLEALTETTNNLFQLDDVVAVLLDMKPEEREAVQASIDTLIRQQREIESSRLEVLDQPISEKYDWIVDKNEPDLLITFYLPAFPEDGAKLKHEFRANIESALGSSRAEMFLAISDRQFDVDLGGVGEHSRWITFTEKVAPDGFLNISRFEGNSNGHWGNSSTTVDPDHLHRNYTANVPARWNDLVTPHYQRGELLKHPK